MQVRPVEPEEYEEAGRVIIAAYMALPGGISSDEYAAELTRVEQRSKEAEVLVAVEDDRVLGCVTLVGDESSPWAEFLEPGESEIRAFAVLPAEQGRGTGAALLSVCLERSRQLGKRAVMLHTTPAMERAHRLYARFGFERFEERDWRPLPDVQLLAYRLVL